MESSLTALLKLWDGLKARAEEDPELKELLRRGAAALADLAATLGEPGPERALGAEGRAYQEAGAASSAFDESLLHEVRSDSQPGGESESYNEAYDETHAEAYDESYDEDAELYAEPYAEALGAYDDAPRADGNPAPPRAYRPEREAEEVVTALRLKEAAARWLASHGYTRDPAALDARNALIGEGKARDVYVWTLLPTLVDTQDAPAHRALAEAYANAAGALELFGSAEGGRARREAGALLAEAQSALQRAVSRAYHGDKARFFDPDQHAAFRLLRDYAEAAGAALPFMHLGDAADPDAFENLRARLEAFGERLEEKRALLKRRGKLLNAVRYHADRLTEGAHNPEHDLRRVEELANEFGGSFPLSDPELREAVSRLGGFSSEVVDAVLAFAAPETPDESGRDEPGATEAVARVRALLRGGGLLLIGGEPREEAKRRLEQAFSCEVLWPLTKSHASVYGFEDWVAKDEVSVVVFLVRWSSHAHKDIKAFADALEKPFVRVTGGYHPHAVADAILEQAGERLVTSP